MASRGFLGAGDLLIARYNSGTGQYSDFEGPFLASKFELKPNSDLKEMSSRGRDTYGQVIESVPLPQPAELSVTLSEVNKQALAMALFGIESTLTQGSGSVTDEVAVAKLEKWVQLSKQNIGDSGFVVTNSGATVTYVEGTDYQVNRRLGMIKALEAGAIAADESLKVDFTYAAISGTKILGARESQIRAKVIFDGKNFADGLPYICRVHEAVLTPDSAFDFLADEFATIELTGRLKTPADKTEPFEVELRDA